MGPVEALLLQIVGSRTETAPGRFRMRLQVGLAPNGMWRRFPGPFQICQRSSVGNHRTQERRGGSFFPRKVFSQLVHLNQLQSEGSLSFNGFLQETRILRRRSSSNQKFQRLGCFIALP